MPRPSGQSASHQRAEYQLGIWMCTALNGEIEYAAGNYDSARQYYEQALLLSENAQFMPGTLYVLVELGIVCSASADYLMAADYLRRGIIFNRDLLISAPLFTGLIGIASLFGQQGRHDVVGFAAPGKMSRPLLVHLGQQIQIQP